ncbi:hypothetical protein VTJ49DRAFT_3702 [Mycothermus thermophilus]|uniref:Formin GTPase-binding domain-containing protein n=1 Tax=Humicola insolens TaxID=85995 RepID=A0ABR3VM82_HUMIN
MLKALINGAKALTIGDSGRKAAMDDLFPKVDKAVDGEDCDRDCESCSVQYPKSFRIDESDDLYGFVKGWSTHVLVATGKSDWVHDVASEKGSVMQAIANAKQPANGRLLLSASDMPTPHGTTSYAEPTTVLLLPALLFIDNVTPTSVPTLLESIVSRAPTTASPLEPFSIPPSLPLPAPHAEHILTTRRCQHRAVILLCAHKTRDARCGQSAPLLRKEFRRHLELRGLYRDPDDERPGGVGIYFVSHVGGHKYSANVLVYRRGGNWEEEEEDAQGKAKAEGKEAEGKQAEGQGEGEGEKNSENGEEGGDVGAAQCIWLARVRPEHCEGIVKFTVMQGKVRARTKKSKAIAMSYSYHSGTAALSGLPSTTPPSSSQGLGDSTTPRHHQRSRSKSSVLRSFIGGGHKRNNSDGASLPAASLVAPIATTPAFHMSQQSLAPPRDNPVFHVGFDAAAAAAMEPQRYAHALGELQQNRQEGSPERRGPGPDRTDDMPPPSPSKMGFSSISLRAFASKDKDSSKPPKTRDNAANSSTKPKKSRSATNLVAILRPRSHKNLKQASGDDSEARDKDKENRSPPDHHPLDLAPPPPIFAQFTSSHIYRPPSPRLDSPRDSFSSSSTGSKKPRPKSFQPYATRKDDDSKDAPVRAASGGETNTRTKRMTWGRGSNTPATAALGPAAVPRSGGKSSRPGTGHGPEMPFIDPAEIDKHLEAMLDRRNIPENQRYKMRNLSDTIKMEFIRQDWAEMQAALERPSSHDGQQQLQGGEVDGHQDDGGASPTKKEKKKHGRGLSLTLVRGSGFKSNPSSPTKKKGDSSLGRHFRTKSSESLISEPPPSPFASGGYGSTFLAKVKGQQLPGDFVGYLQKVQKPELVEVGKLHKLRLLLRNETVAWTDEFIRLGGMKEIVELLHRIMAVEWREEHEDALLHENLLCLKALCTTDMALQYLHSIHATLFPALLHMIFDPEKKGPSEFTTRGIITSVLLTYIESAGPAERVSRARAVLGFLRDPEPPEQERPVDFVLEMRRERPYRVWCKEVVNVTKEVFWIFLHNLNIVALPSEHNKSNDANQSSLDTTTGQTTTASIPSTDGTPSTSASSSSSSPPISPDHLAYMTRHFPQARPPVPAAPYVGGVEWDATNYLASHLDLLNAILACTGPSAKERNALREQLRISGWERCLGGSLRLCKEKFYGAVHDGLRTWVAAAHEDGWDVRDVRYGPPPPEQKQRGAEEKRSPGKKKVRKEEEKGAPRIEMPKLDFLGGGGCEGG